MKVKIISAIEVRECNHYGILMPEYSGDGLYGYYMQRKRLWEEAEFSLKKYEIELHECTCENTPEAAVCDKHCDTFGGEIGSIHEAELLENVK